MGELFVIDNLMSALGTLWQHKCRPTILLQHVKTCGLSCPFNPCNPSKQGKGRGEKLEKEDISGSNNIPNKADIIISIERQFRMTSCDAGAITERPRRSRFVEVKLIFQETTKRFLELEGDKVRPINYNWRQYLEDADWYEVDIEENDLPF